MRLLSRLRVYTKQLSPQLCRYIVSQSKMQPQLFIPSYLKSTHLYSLNTRVSGIKDNNKLMFEDTIFHPQGGGQPRDKGWVSLAANEADKREIINATSDKETGEIWNEVGNAEGVKIGDEVKITIDENVRNRHAKLHSAGHLIDLAVQNLGYGWQTAKGYHFQDGPYVQYKGPNQNLQQKAAKLNEELAKIIESNINTMKQHYGYQEAVEKGLIPKQFKTPLIRIIKFGPNSCPCGGTHIQNTGQIKKLYINKLAKKGKFLRANYVVE